MAKIGEQPVIITEGINLVQEGNQIKVSGPLGTVVLSIPEEVELKIENGQVVVVKKEEGKDAGAIQGTIARLIKNATIGVTKGFSKSLEVVGTGYRAVMEGSTLVLSLGYSHQIKFPAPDGVKIEAVENKINITGSNKEQLGDVAYKIKQFRKPDSYKGKGIRYLGEKLRLKPGKAAAKVGGAAKS